MILRVIGRRVLATCSLALCVVATAFAQGEGIRTPVANDQVVSANPFLLMFEYANVEFERTHTETRTFGVSA